MENVEEFRIFDDTERAMATRNPQGKLHTMSGRIVGGALCKYSDGTRFRRVDRLATVDVAYEIACTFIMPNSSDGYGWVAENKGSALKVTRE